MQEEVSFKASIILILVIKEFYFARFALRYRFWNPPLLVEMVNYHYRSVCSNYIPSYFLNF